MHERDRERREQGESSSHPLHLRHGRVRPCAYDPPDAARSRDRTRGGTARRLGGGIRARAGAQARTLADRGRPGRPDAQPRPRHARPPRQRALLAALQRALPARAPRCASACTPRGPVRAQVVAPGGRVVRDLGRARRTRAGASSRAGTGATPAGRSARDGSYRLRVQRLGPQHRAAQPARARHGRAHRGHERLAPRDLARLRLARPTA